MEAANTKISLLQVFQWKSLLHSLSCIYAVFWCATLLVDSGECLSYLLHNNGELCSVPCLICVFDCDKLLFVIYGCHVCIWYL